MQTQYEHGTNVYYNFPVKLVDVFTKEGKQVPRSKAVFRTDENRPIAAVSDRYRLITHEEVIDRSQDFMKKLGEFDVIHTLDKDGARVMSEYTFNDRTIDIGGGDVMALRAYVDNSYNGSKSARIRLGAWRLVCKNGLIIGKTAMDLVFRHIGQNKIDWGSAFPNPDLISDHFTQESQKWKRYTVSRVKKADAIELIDNAAEQGLIPNKSVDSFIEELEPEVSFWDIYNLFTAEITHNVRAKSYINRISRLERASRWLDNAYADLFMPKGK